MCIRDRKCVTWCAPRGDSFHQVWSLYDHWLPRYSVIAADTLRDLVTLTFDLLTLLSGHTWRVTWSTPPPSLKILWLSVLELWVLTFLIGYHWQDRAGHLEARFVLLLLCIVLYIDLQNFRWCVCKTNVISSFRVAISLYTKQLQRGI